MRLPALTITLLTSISCLAQLDYKTKFAARVKEISELNQVNAGVVFSEGFEHSDWTPWSPDRNFYTDDIVDHKGCLFRATSDSKGKDPFISRKEWTIYRGLHPYIFLRDTAKIEDLRALLKTENLFVRIYTVAALAQRRQDDLYPFVRSHLGDTTQIDQYSSDYGYAVRPADLMLWFTMDQFTVAQKDELKRLIIKDYRHLDCLRQVLMYFNGHPDDYAIIREILREGSMYGFGLIALAKYCRVEDFETIRMGFSMDGDYLKGSFDFCKAIENCPNNFFKQNLLDSKRNYDNNYAFALAAFKDPDCLKVLEEMSNDRSGFRAVERAAVVYYALKKHYHPMYDKLIAELEKRRGKADWQWYGRSRSRWDY
jgi:hypothetical protein